MSDDGEEDEEYGDTGDTGIFDTDTEETSDSWCDRLSSSCGGICIGLLFFFGAFPLLFWNEGRAVERYDTLNEGQSITKPISVESIDPTNQGELVYFSAPVRSTGNITDPIFGISTDDLKLARDVEIYQWTQKVQNKKQKNVGGSTTTTKTYSYSKEWLTYVVDSANFKRSGEHNNTGSLLVPQMSVASDDITVGAFQLPQELIDRISWYQPLAGGVVSKDSITDSVLRAKAIEYNSGFYFGINNVTDMSSPVIGDVRVSFNVVPSGGIISVIAQQSGNTFTSYEAKAGGSLLLFERGYHPAEALYTQAASDNKVVTWLLRFAGFFVMGLGMYLVLRPIEVFADVLPCVGGIVGFGIKIVAFVVTGLLSGLTIAIAWLIHHPIIGIVVLVVSISITAAIAFLVKRCQSKNKEKGLDSDDGDLELSPEEE